MTYLISPEAKRDIIEIWDYIAQNDPIAADKVVDSIYDAIQTLSISPGIGHKRSDIKTKRPVRFWSVFRHYQIIYLDDLTPLFVVRIVSGYRDLVTLLK